MLTVSMPTYRTPPELLDRAITSVVEQTYPQVRLVVVNDGGPPLGLPLIWTTHPAVTVYDLEDNRGRYWCDSMVLAATTDGWFAVHDADDWSEPDRFARLIDVAGPDGAALARYWRHQLDGRTTLAEPRIRRPDGRLHHLGHWCSGVYTVDRMEQAGGIHPEFRVGFDTLHTLMIRLTGPLAVDETPGYHWTRREGSLSTAKDTRQGSRFRHRTRLRLERIYRDAYAAWRRGDDPGQVIRDDVPSSVRAEIWKHAANLEGTLA